MIPSKQISLGLVLLLFIAAFVFSINIITSPSNATSASNNTITYTMRLHTLDGAPDGVNRTLIGVNGGYGWDFVLRARQGQKLIVHVINDLDEPTTIHWHGIYQNRSNVYDGTSHVTQCPIPAHSELTYSVKLEQAGTYWWHSHHGPQYIDGLRGPMIIDPVNEDHLKYDEELIVQLSDWYHRQGSDIVQAINSPSLDINRPKDIIPDSAIVNGHGRFNCSFINASCNPGVPRAQFNVLPGRTYRVRLINTAAFAGFNVSLDGHNMTVVSVDGIDVVPTTVNHLRINVAQRYDVLVHTPVSIKGNFWFRATMNNVAPLFFLVPYAGQDIYGLGIWSYDNSSADPTSAESSELLDLDDFALVPFVKSTPPKPDASFNFTINILKDNVTNVTGPHVAIDNGPAFPYRYTEYPTLFSVVANEPLPKQIHPFVVNQSSTVDITVINYNQGEHPFHMHGHSFWVLAHGTGLTLPTTEALNLLENPLQRDTVAVTACESFRGECMQPGWTIIRVRLDNPGVWLFHCHIEWDMATGMGMTLIVNPSEIQALGVPKDIQSTCPANNNDYFDSSLMIIKRSQKLHGHAHDRPGVMPRCWQMCDLLGEKIATFMWYQKMRSILCLLGVLAAVQAKELQGFGSAKHVIVLGLDGLDVRCLHQALDNGLAPNMHYIRTHGQFTDKARNNRPTVSLTNWATIFYGASAMFHGVTSNEWTYCAPSNESMDIQSILPACVVYPDVFSVTKEQLPDASTAMFYTWRGFDAILPSEVVNVDTHEYFDNDESCNSTLSASKDATAAAVALLSNASTLPTLLFLYLGEADNCAHETNCFSDEGQAAIASMDENIGAVMNAVKASGQLNSTVFLLVTDHGRNEDGQDHRDPNVNNEQVQWAVYGLGNANRELKSAISIEDTAPTIAHILGFTTPLEWHGRVVKEVFLKANESLYSAAKSPWNECMMNSCELPADPIDPYPPGLNPSEINWVLGLTSTGIMLLAIGIALMIRFCGPRQGYEAVS